MGWSTSPVGSAATLSSALLLLFEVATRALELDPNCVAALTARAAAHLDLGNLTDAEADIKGATFSAQ